MHERDVLALVRCMKPMGRPDPGSGVNSKDGRMRQGRPAVMLVGSRYASD